MLSKMKNPDETANKNDLVLVRKPQNSSNLKDVSEYEKLTKICEGTFAGAFKARHQETKQIVVLKEVRREKEGFPISSLREIKILLETKHENIVNLIQVCGTEASSKQTPPTFYLVFDFYEHDLAGLLSDVNVKFTLAKIKMILKQLFSALYFIHDENILHRDVRTTNILMTKQDVLKLAGFGLAKRFHRGDEQSPNKFTDKVATWYMAPELLLGERHYGPPIDMWGAGCVMAEMWTRSPIMQGATEQDQLDLITDLCGSITPVSFPGVELPERFKNMDLNKTQERKVIERLKPHVKDDHALDLLDKLLTLDPDERIDSDDVRTHKFFSES